MNPAADAPPPPPPQQQQRNALGERIEMVQQKIDAVANMIFDVLERKQKHHYKLRDLMSEINEIIARQKSKYSYKTYLVQLPPLFELFTSVNNSPELAGFVNTFSGSNRPAIRPTFIPRIIDFNLQPRRDFIPPALPPPVPAAAAAAPQILEEDIPEDDDDSIGEKESINSDESAFNEEEIEPEVIVNHLFDLLQETGPIAVADIQQDLPNAQPQEEMQPDAELPDAPAELPDAPAELPDGPAELPDAPAALPDAPAELPDGPAELPDGPAALPDGPDAEPAVNMDNFIDLFLDIQPPNIELPQPPPPQNIIDNPIEQQVFLPPPPEIVNIDSLFGLMAEVFNNPPIHQEAQPQPAEQEDINGNGEEPPQPIVPAAPVPPAEIIVPLLDLAENLFHDRGLPPAAAHPMAQEPAAPVPAEEIIVPLLDLAENLFHDRGGVPLAAAPEPAPVPAPEQVPANAPIIDPLLDLFVHIIEPAAAPVAREAGIIEPLLDLLINLQIPVPVAAAAGNIVAAAAAGNIVAAARPEGEGDIFKVTHYHGDDKKDEFYLENKIKRDISNNPIFRYLEKIQDISAAAAAPAAVP